jgi:hypothetical protein
MPTEFVNIKNEDGSGEVRTISEWGIWDCVDKKWIGGSPVVLRNILLAASHPTPGERFCIGEIPKDTKPEQAWRLNPFTPGGGKKYELDLASGSRNHGRFTFAINPVGLAYYGLDWKRIIYGSIVHTGCKRLVYKTLNIVVTDDENRDLRTGDQLDDPINGVNWFTGDSHAKASSDFMMFLGLPVSEDGSEDEKDPNTPIQFRVSEFKKWVGKGTVSWNPDMDSTAIDLAIPHSCMKGNKPPLGNHTMKLLLGVVFEAEERRAKLGWMFLQWFSMDSLNEDAVIFNLEVKCKRLHDAYNNIQALADVLRIDQAEAEQEVENNDGLQSEAEYVNTMIRIIQADKHGILLLHPYVVTRVKERMQAMWLNLAKAAGMRFFSVMTQPDESLAYYHAVLPNGKIVGRKVVCVGDFEEGEYIVFCNPMRHWGDVQLWENKHEGAYINSHGTMAGPTKLLLSLGRDFDGDFVQLIKSSAYPAIAQEIREFSDTPNVEKLPKVALPGNLQQIAVRSMNDATGIVASLLGRARAARAENIVMLIPPGGMQKEAKEFRLIDFLSQELQIAVDSLKSAYPNNMKGLNYVGAELDKLGATAPWLADFKKPECYRDRPCDVNSDATDTVSRIVKLVNSYWRAPDLMEDSSPRSYQPILFGDVPHAPEQYDYAIGHRDKYRGQMGDAIKYSIETGDETKIREVAQATKSSRDRILNSVNTATNEPYSLISWVSAYWKASHQADTGSAGLVFMLFPDEIVEKLSGADRSEADVIEVYGCQYGSWAAPERTPWKGQTVIIRAFMKEVTGRQRLCLEMKWEAAKTQTGWHYLGIVGEGEVPYLLPGHTREMRIYSVAFISGKTNRVKLFDLSMSQEQIDKEL